MHDITVPPNTKKIARINPAIGTPVCCIGISFVFAFNVAVTIFAVVIGSVIFVGFTVRDVKQINYLFHFKIKMLEL